MTNEQQRIAIAEACGWQRWQSKDGSTVGLYKPSIELASYWAKEGCTLTDKPITPSDLNYLKCPNYPSDLNACHEMEKVLDNEQQAIYYHQLCKLTDALGPAGHTFHWYPAVATAPQRCEAFLRTMGRWV